MTFELFIILLMTFGLATGFKNTRLLRIPIGIFLFFIGVIVKDSMGLKEFIFFLIACALPFVFAKSDTLVNLLKKRTRRPLKFNYEGFIGKNIKEKAQACISDNSYKATSTNITISEINFTPSSDLKSEIIWQTYLKRSFFIFPIFVFHGSLFPDDFTTFAELVKTYIDNEFIGFIVYFSSAALILFIEKSFLFSDGEYESLVNEIGKEFKDIRRNELIGKAEKERKALAQKEANEKKKLKKERSS